MIKSRTYGRKIVACKKPGGADKGDSGLRGVIVDGLFLKGETPESVQKPPAPKRPKNAEVIIRRRHRATAIELKRGPEKG